MPDDIAKLRALAWRLKEAKSSYESWQRPGMSPDYGPSGAARCLELFRCADEASAAILSLLDELDRLTKALAFYANKDDGGKHARAALSDETGI